MAEVRLVGDKDIERMLRALPQAVTRKIIISAERRALKPALAAMKSNASARVGKVTGRYHRSIGIKVLRGSSTWRVASLAGVRYGGTLGAPHAHLLETGTKERQLSKPRVLQFTTPAGQSVTAVVRRTGKVAARNVIRDAIQQTQSQVVDGMERAMLESIVTTMKRYARKHA